MTPSRSVAGEGRREGREEGVVRGKGTPVGKPEEEGGSQVCSFPRLPRGWAEGGGKERDRGREGASRSKGSFCLSFLSDSSSFLTPTKLKLLYH